MDVTLTLKGSRGGARTAGRSRQRRRVDRIGVGAAEAPGGAGREGGGLREDGQGATARCARAGGLWLAHGGA